MKKLLSLILVVVLVLPAAACADLPDISSLTDQELLDLCKMIGVKLFGEKLADGIIVPPGEYIVGEDIPAGNYKITISGGMGFYDVYNKKGGYIVMSGVAGEPYNVLEIGKLTLEDGNILELTNSTFTFYPYLNLFN